METCKLLIKSMPCEMEELAQLIQELNLIIPRSLNNFGRRRAILEYVNPGEAQLAYDELKGLDNLLDKPLRLSPFGNKSSNTESSNNKANKSSQTKSKKEKQLPATRNPREQQKSELNKYVPKPSQQTHEPPPYLRYNYPSINNDILAAISQSLVNNTKFYYQVLHLMNRMNLEPPFKKRQKSLLQTQYRPSVGTQTKPILEEEKAENTLPSASESELESDTEAYQSKPKRPCLDKEQEEQRRQKRLKKTRQMLQQLAKTAPANPTHIQATPQPTITLSKIELKLPQSLTSSSISKERLSLSELQYLPIYRNYQEGAPSHKLYIKNLSKNVNEPQLLELYGKYVTTVDHLEVKVMQQGRMKGQAFVTFDEEINQSIVAQALSETNGLLWQQKPMIVCYGKQQAKKD